jgi:hypothetical protein
MIDRGKSNDAGAVRKGDPTRAERLRATLRQNLKRRRSQARKRAEQRPDEVTHDSAGFATDKAED